MCFFSADFAVHPTHIWLGATPDGTIGEDGLLEIVRLQFRNGKERREGEGEGEGELAACVFWIIFIPDRPLSYRSQKCPMHRTHEGLPPHYMAQVQGQLEIMDRAWCDFVSWRPAGSGGEPNGRMVVIHVPRSREYWAWLYPLLERFYMHVMTDEPLPESASTPPPPPTVFAPGEYTCHPNPSIAPVFGSICDMLVRSPGVGAELCDAI